MDRAELAELLFDYTKQIIDENDFDDEAVQYTIEEYLDAYHERLPLDESE